MIRISFLLVLLILVSCKPAEKEANLRISERARSLNVLRSSLAKINDPDHFWTAILAAEGLISAGYDREAVSFIAPLLEAETDAQKRCGLARELMRSGIGGGERVMTEILQTKTSGAIPIAAESLFQVGAVGDEQSLRATMNHNQDPQSSMMAAAALARARKDSAAFEMIREKLINGSSKEIEIAAKILVRIGNDSDTSRLQAALEHKDLTPIATATIHHALAALGDSSSMEKLAANLNSENKKIRTNAAVSAGHAGAVHLIDELANQLNDPELEARVRAAQSILILTQN